MGALISVRDGRLIILPVTERKILNWFQSRKSKKLIGVLANEELNVDLRAMAAIALGRLKSKTALRQLSQILLDGKSLYLRTKCAIALGMIADPSAYQVLKEAACSHDPNLCRKAIEAIGFLTNETNRDFLDGKLACKDPETREAALVALSRSQVADRMEYLCHHLKDPTPNARMIAANCLGRLKDPRCIPALIQAFEVNGWKNYAVLDSLGKFSSDQFGSYLPAYQQLRRKATHSANSMRR